jgi:hypothetical protein
MSTPLGKDLHAYEGERDQPTVTIILNGQSSVRVISPCITIRCLGSMRVGYTCKVTYKSVEFVLEALGSC